MTAEADLELQYNVLVQTLGTVETGYPVELTQTLRNVILPLQRFLDGIVKA